MKGKSQASDVSRGESGLGPACGVPTHADGIEFQPVVNRDELGCLSCVCSVAYRLERVRNSHLTELSRSK